MSVPVGSAAVRRLVALVALPLVLGLTGPAVHAQQRLDVVAEFVAGSNLYLSAGTDSGIFADDTLLVFTQADGVLLGAFIVMSATRDRAVVTFAGDPFPVTRGKTLHVVTGRAVGVARPGPAARPERRRARSARGTGTQVSGRLSVDVNALQTSSEASGIDGEPTHRAFTSPTARLRFAATQLPGGLQLQLNLRASVRHSSPDLVQPATSFRVYQASVERDWKAAQFKVGRFYNPYETYSGYWDGGLVHLGGGGLGIGGAIGYQPQRSNELFSPNLLKYTVFVNAAYRRSFFRWDTDLSYHELRPRNGAANHVFAGWSQQLWLGRFQVSHRLRLDRSPSTGGWTVTQLLARSSIPLGRNVSVRLRYALRQTYSLLQPDVPITPRRDQGSVGLSVWLGGGTLSADVTANRVRQQSASYTYSGSLTFPHTAVLGLGVSGSVNYWVFAERKAVFLSGALSRTFGRGHVRASYSRYETEGLAAVLTHTGELSLTIPWTRQLYSMLQGRIQRGENLNSNGLYASLWVNF